MKNPSSENDLINGINVTPFVDIVLVLLVIFMVTAPILAKDLLQIHLPKVGTTDGKGLSPLSVAVNKQGQLLVSGQLVTEEVLSEQVRELVKKDANAQAIISADVAAEYGAVARAIDLVKSGGLSHFALQVEHRND